MIDLEKLKKEQSVLAKRLLLSDGFDGIRTVAGCDVAYTGSYIIAAMVVMDYKTLKIRESAYTFSKAKFPYIPGFLSYREAPQLVETYHKLEIDPDILIVDGNGILHPRGIGVASHLGLLTDKPSIGIAKSLLCGEQQGSSIYMGKDIVGKAIAVKEIAKPIFLSQGHKVSLQSALEISKSTFSGHKLPEPLHEAHKLASKIKRKIRDNKKQDLE